MDRDKYINEFKCMRQLNNTEYYQPVDNNFIEDNSRFIKYKYKYKFIWIGSHFHMSSYTEKGLTIMLTELC